jgi:hypothetical protein
VTIRRTRPALCSSPRSSVALPRQQILIAPRPHSRLECQNLPAVRRDTKVTGVVTGSHREERTSGDRPSKRSSHCNTFTPPSASCNASASFRRCKSSSTCNPMCHVKQEDGASLLGIMYLQNGVHISSISYLRLLARSEVSIAIYTN